MRSAIVLTVLTLAGIAWYGFEVRTIAPLPLVDTTLDTVQTPRNAVQAYIVPLSNPTYAPIRDTNVPDPTIDASVALVIDLDSGSILYEHNADTRVPVASLTKLLSALVVRETLDRDELVTIASTSVRVDRERQTLYTGERLFVSDLVALMLVESSNDAAHALAVVARTKSIDFVERMNAKATTLGMQNCSFKDPTGLDDTAYCTANDLIRLVRAFRRDAPDLWSLTTLTGLQIRSVDGKFVHEVKNTNELLGTLPNILGGKTGNTDGALGCMLLVVQAPGGRGTLASVVLGSRARFVDTRTLVDWAGRAYRWQ